jgi:hypothetical protein
MTGPIAFPDWVPPWAQLAVLIVGVLFGLAFMLMPFSVFGVKSRLEGVEARLDEIQGEIRALALRLPEPGRRASFDDGPYIHPMAPPEPAMSRPPIPPAAWAVEAPRRPGSAAPTRTEPSYRPRVEPRIDRTS